MDIQLFPDIEKYWIEAVPRSSAKYIAITQCNGEFLVIAIILCCWCRGNRVVRICMCEESSNVYSIFFANISAKFPFFSIERLFFI